MDTDWMILRHLVEVIYVELAIVLNFGVIEEVPVDPKIRRSLRGFRTKLVDDAGDSDKLDLIRIADEDFVKQDVAASVVMAINETGHDRHLLCIETLRAFADETFGLVSAPHEEESSAPDRKSFSIRHAGIDGVDLGVEYHQVSVARVEICPFPFSK